MKSAIKKILHTLFPTTKTYYRAFRSLIKNRKSYLYATGWIQSIDAEKPVDKDGNPVPWMNFPIIALLKEKLTSDLRLFEYGSGYSTYFYAGKVNNVVSVEYDQRWHEFVKSNAPSNVTVIYQQQDNDGDYCRVINTLDSEFDVVVVDGRDRINCVKQSLPKLSAKGVILLDDSQREKYEEAITYATDRHFRALNIEGLKATGNKVVRTTILYRDGNCLGI